MDNLFQKWIEAGYEIFSLEGPEGVQVEKLARTVRLNKSGFYHYFSDKETFFTKLIEHHYKLNEQFNKELTAARQFDPDVLNLIIKYKAISFFQMQLCTHSDNKAFTEAFIRVKKKNEKPFVRIWAEYLKIQDNISLARDLWDIMRDIYFIRLSNSNLTFESLRLQIQQFNKIVQVLKQYCGKIRK